MFRAIDIVRKYDMEMSIAFTPTSFNIEELEELHTKLESMSFNNKIELRVQPLMPLGRGNKNLENICPTDINIEIGKHN